MAVMNLIAPYRVQKSTLGGKAFILPRRTVPKPGEGSHEL